jgi:hypothetical protein
MTKLALYEKLEISCYRPGLALEVPEFLDRGGKVVSPMYWLSLPP